MNANELLDSSGVSSRVRRLQEKYDLRFAVVFEAVGKRAGKNWKSNYAVMALVVALPPKDAGMPDDLYQEAIQIFQSAHEAVGRAKTFFCLRFVPKLKNPSWSLELFLSDDDLDKNHAEVQAAAKPIVLLMSQNAEFRDSCSDGPHLLVAYNQRDQRVVGFQSQVPVAFDQPYAQSTKVEQELMSDNCGRNITQMSEVFLGNVSHARNDMRGAIEHWQRAADAGVKDAPFCIACAYCDLGDMEQTFEFCKRAIQVGDPLRRLDDPDLAKFRLHPLFEQLKEWNRSKRATTRPPAPIPKPRIPLPEWIIPGNLENLVADGDGTWEDKRFDPVLLTVMSGNSYQGREIPQTWQIEFDPYDDRLAAASEKLEDSGIEPDGDGWAEFIEKKFAKHYPELAGELHSDSESSTCVLWVESEDVCKKLVELIWSQFHPK